MGKGLSEVSDFELCKKAQSELCKKLDLPHFAPRDGYCFRCHQPIYGGKGITLERAGSRLVTGCPHCNYSYCD